MEDESFLREYLIGAGVVCLVYMCGVVVAARRWSCASSSFSALSLVLPSSAAAALPASAVLAWSLLALGRLLHLSFLLSSAPLLSSLLSWCSGSLSLALLLFAYFWDESVGFLGATTSRGRLLESAVLSLASLVLAWAGSRASAALGLPVAAVALAWTLGAAAAVLPLPLLLRAVVAAAALASVSANVAALREASLLLAALALLAQEPRQPHAEPADATPRMCWRALQALVVVQADEAAQLGMAEYVLIAMGFWWNLLLNFV